MLPKIEKEDLLSYHLFEARFRLVHHYIYSPMRDKVHSTSTRMDAQINIQIKSNNFNSVGYEVFNYVDAFTY